MQQPGALLSRDDAVVGILKLEFTFCTVAMIARQSETIAATVASGNLLLAFRIFALINSII